MAGFPYKKADEVIRVIQNLPRKAIYDPEVGIEYYEDEVVSTGLDRSAVNRVNRKEQLDIDNFINMLERSAKDVEVDFNLRKQVGENYNFLRQVIVDKGDRP